MANTDAIALLKSDHRTVKQLFKDFRSSGERAHATRRRIVDRIITELSIHAGIEETVFYPRIRSAIPKAEDDVLESLEEHHIVKTTLSELEKMDPKDERFEAKVTVLIENVEHHVQEEETELFPKVRRALGRSELISLAEELEAAKSIVPTRPHPHAPDEPPGNIAAAAVSTPMDAVLKGVKTAARRGTGIISGAGGDR